MDEIEQQITDLIQTKPKHFSQIIKRNKQLADYVNKHKSVTSSVFSEEIYSVLNPDISNVCDISAKEKRFKNITEGYGFCGRSSICECSRISVSNKVSKAKLAYTEEQKSDINKKRKVTNVNAYGVSNTCQTKKAKDNHRRVYRDSDTVSEINSKISNTKQNKYGDKNYNNSTKIKKTWKDKKNKYFITRYPDKDLESLYDKTMLQHLYKTLSLEEIAIKLNVHIQTVYKYLHAHNIKPKYTSTLETDMIVFLKSIGINNIIQNTRKIISKELDIYLPDYNVAIEMNGIYWHHDQVPHIDRQYHYAKFKECESNNIQLISIFSDAWENKKDIIKSMISYKLGNNTKPTVYARKTTVVTVDSKTAADFLNTNHIQGNTPASYRYGLQYNNELVALMTFSKPRTGIGKQRKNTAELVRYATSSQVTGGAGKLLKHFIKTHCEFKYIISYSDNEWSRGDMYHALGFDLEKEQKPSYFYFHPAEKIRKHRYNFAKHKLVKLGFDKDLTEYQIQQDRGYLRIWDCGKRTWIFSA